MPKTDGERVVADLKRLAEFGRYKTGVHRPTYSAEDVASRQWLSDKFAEAGLDPLIDGIGNVIGRNPRAQRRLLVGSHSETQPHGGWLDGALGVIYGLELARAFAADPARYVGYLEAHIEQGDTLDSAGSRIGIVEGIVGIWNYWVTLSGEQNHAGTTQMRRRKDAGAT